MSSTASIDEKPSTPEHRGHRDSKYDGSSSSSDSSSTRSSSPTQNFPTDINQRLANPLADLSEEELRSMGRNYAINNISADEADIFERAAVLAANPEGFEDMKLLTEEEKQYLRDERKRKWHQPLELYKLVIMCSMAAAVQGMDETVINGAQLFFRTQFGIHNGDQRSEILLGLVNSAPYLCCAVIGCWLTHPLNKFFGRRHTIFITCAISFLSCIWQGFTNSWRHLFAARFVLGLGIGPKSSTVPVYAAECSPPQIRGALVMMWQMFTAFGIMVGFAADLAFYNVKSESIEGLNWRLMLGSACFPALIVCFQVYFSPESPRWYMSKNRHQAAFKAISRLRWTKLQAARDLFYMHTLLRTEQEISRGRNKFLEIFTIPRNRRAMQASQIVMFMQQFCGVNVIAYYSSVIFVEGGFSELTALATSLGWGAINFLFAFPAVYTIDTYGRRALLLTTFPLMSLALLFAGFSFWIPENTARIACIATGIYLFGAVYSPGEGPVPFTYSAEAYPLYIRDLGMSLATATTWGFNWVLSISWPSLLRAFKPPGAFAYYAGWNIVGFFLVLFFLPETKGRTLEELDAVFGVSTRKHAAYAARQVPYFFKKYISRQKVEAETLYEWEKVVYHESSFSCEKEAEQDRRV